MSPSQMKPDPLLGDITMQHAFHYYTFNKCTLHLFGLVSDYHLSPCLDGKSSGVGRDVRRACIWFCS